MRVRVVRGQEAIRGLNADSCQSERGRTVCPIVLCSAVAQAARALVREAPVTLTSQDQWVGP
jgi:hypothetical protein